MTRADLSQALIDITARASLTTRDTTTIRQAAEMLIPTEAEQRDQRVAEAMRLAGVVLRDADDVVEMIRRLAENIGADTETTRRIAKILDGEIP